MSARLVLVLGGTRSGKSRFGQQRASANAGAEPVTYLATARSGDPELEERIAGHRAARPADWPTIEVSDDLAATIGSVSGARTILLDGLTLWLSAAFDPARMDVDGFMAGPLTRALEAIERRKGAVVIVSDEIGLGMVPLDAGARAFRDLIGIAHQRIAAAADEVTLMVAGLPMALKPA
jgi:adenosylcobinamide kinase/adenosylcobinamide-phosphate guanylyltransferase